MDIIATVCMSSCKPNHTYLTTALTLSFNRSVGDNCLSLAKFTKGFI